MIVVHADTPCAVRRGASETRQELDATHVSLLLDAVMEHATDDDDTLTVRRGFPVPDALPTGASTEQRVDSVLDEVVSGQGIFVDALDNGEEACVSMRSVLERQSAAWQNLLKLPRCVKVSTNQTTVHMQAMLSSVLTSSMGFDDIPWRTDEYDLSFGQRAVILYYCVEPSMVVTERVELEVNTEWIRHLSVAGKAPARVTPYRTALNIRGCRPSIELLTCVTGFGKTLTAIMIGLMDACHPKLWKNLLVEFRARVHEKRCIPKAGGIYEGNDPEAHKLARVILVICDTHLIPQWRDAAIHAARGMYMHLDDMETDAERLRICILQERFDLEVLASAPPNYVFVVIARPTTCTSDALRAHPNVHIVSRFDDELATNLTRDEAPEVRNRQASTSLGRRFRILESVVAKRHMCVNATLGSMAATMRIPHHPLRELLAGYSGTCGVNELPTHKNLANAIVRGWSADAELHLEQFARLTFTIMPPELLKITVDDALAQMTPAFRIVRLRCSLATLDGRLHGLQENDMMSNDLVNVVKSVCSMPDVEFGHVVGPTLATLSSETTPTNSRIVSTVRQLSRAILESARALDNDSIVSKRQSQASTLSRLANRIEEAQNGAECAVCMDSLQAPAEAVIMMCCTNMLCKACTESLQRCVFCRCENPTRSLSVHDIIATNHQASSNEGGGGARADDGVFSRLLLLNRRPRSILATCFAAIDEILAHKPFARILVGMKHRSANATDTMLQRFRDTYPTANVEDIESMSTQCDADTCSEKRNAFNDRIGHRVSFLWIIDSALTSSSLAGIDLPTTDVVVMTTQMDEAAQWQLAGRAVRRTPLHKLEEGQLQPDEKTVILLSTS